MQKYTNNVQDSSGNAQPGDQIMVVNAGTGVAVTIYSDNGITPTTNPITADSTGTFSFYAANGRYSLTITGPGASSRTLSDIVLFDPADAGAVAATSVSASDGSSGSLWTTVQGFINKIISSAGSSVVGFIQSGTGAVSRFIQEKLRETVSVLDFGAVGDGVTDDTASILAALNTGKSRIFFPYKANGYKVSSTLTPAANQTLEGDAYNFDGGTIITMAAGINLPLIKFTSGGVIRNLALHGSATGALTSQNLVYINNTNGVKIDGCFLTGGYNLVYIDGTSFYCTLNDVTLYSAVNTQLNVNSATAAGVDLILNNVRFLNLPSTAVWSAYFFGLGSLLASNVQFSLNNGTGGTVVFDTPATNFGGAQWSSCVFENGGTTTGVACYIKGTLANKWTGMRFTNTQITGGNGVGLRMDYVNGAYFTNTTLSGVNASGNTYIPASGNVQDVTFTDCDWEGNAGTAPVQCGTPVTLSASFVSPRWTGTASFIDFSNAAAGNVIYLNVVGGNVGSNSVPVKLNNPVSISGLRIFNAAWDLYTPTVSAASGAITTYTATGAYQRVGASIYFMISVSITNNGTGATAVNVTLPSTPVSFAFGSGKDAGVSGKMIQAYAGAGSNTLIVASYDGTYPAATNSILQIAGMYRAQ